MNSHGMLLQRCTDRLGSLFVRSGSRFDGKLRVEDDGVVALDADDRGQKVFMRGLVGLAVKLDEVPSVPQGAESSFVKLSEHRSVDGVPVKDDGQMVMFARATISTSGGDGFHTDVLDPDTVVLVPRSILSPELLLKLRRSDANGGRTVTFDPFDHPAQRSLS